MSDRPPVEVQDLYKNAILAVVRSFSEEEKERIKPQLAGKSLREQLRIVAKEAMKNYQEPALLKRFQGIRAEDL